MIITINREFGTGGHEIGTKLAEKLGVKMIDREVAAAIAEKFEMTEEELEKVEHKKMSWWDEFCMFYKPFIEMQVYEPTKQSITSRKMFVEQTKLLRNIVEEESCVIIGRCAFDIFKNYERCVRVFIHASDETRVKRVMEKQHVNEIEARKLMEQIDNKRATYINMYTERNWHDNRCYDLSLNVDKLGVEGAVEYIYEFIQKTIGAEDR